MSAERVQRLNEFARDRHPGMCGVATGRLIALFRCTQMVLLPRASGG